MKALIVYDSFFGCTEKIARAIAGALAPPGEVKVLRPSEVDPSDLQSVDLLIIGSPTRWTRPTKSIEDFLNKLPDSAVKGINIAAFDTRLPGKLVAISGVAAGKIVDNLKKKGGNLILPPEPFFVKARKGPLKDGEVERAAAWAKRILESKK